MGTEGPVYICKMYAGLFMFRDLEKRERSRDILIEK